MVPADQSSQIPWWKKTAVYQIYPRSFMDSNGDGIGDLQGIIERLDHVRELGFETIWFSPFYASPQEDHGYDVADYLSIAPEYGDVATAERLIREIHERDMKVVFDMVMNHTSDQHPWFVESRSGRDSPKRDWYVWRDGRKPGGKKPPNNWRSMLGGSGWHYDGATDQWYWAQFLPFQPDLNYRNPEVKRAMFDVVRFWLEKGVDGFRLDIINTIYEDAEFRDNPRSLRLIPSEDDPSAFFQRPEHTQNHPDTFQFARELREVVDEFDDPPRFLVGEVAASMPILRQYCGQGDQNDGLNAVFIFQSMSVPLKAAALRRLVARVEENFPEPFTPTWVFSNHDRMRRVSRLGNDPAKAKLNAAFQFTSRGIPFTYYGEEIGMPQAKIPLKRGQDPIAKRFSWIPQWLANAARRLVHESLNRDECRTPMQWDASPNAGFCPEGVEPWLPVAPEHEEINVESQKADPESVLNCYKRLLALRRKTPALNAGGVELLGLAGQAGKSVLAYARTPPPGEKGGTVYVLLNASKRPQVASLPRDQGPVAWRLLFSTSATREDAARAAGGALGRRIDLSPWEGVVVVSGD
ncbi:MAG: alpha-glucosidase [Promethearchaeota archaeon]